MEAEREAQAMVEAARKEAEHLVTDAQRAAREVVARGKQEAASLKQTRLQSALEAVEAERANRLAKAMVAIEQDVAVDEQTRQRLVAAVVRCACGRPLSEEGE